MNVDELSHNYIFNSKAGEYLVPIEGLGSLSYRRYMSRAGRFFEIEEKLKRRKSNGFLS